MAGINHRCWRWLFKCKDHFITLCFLISGEPAFLPNLLQDDTIKTKTESINLVAGDSTRLDVGDTVPESILSLIHAEKKEKLIILDFWATWCTPCLKGFSKLDSLQDEYEDKLKVVLVNSKSTGDDKKRIDDVLKKRPFSFNFQLLSEDTIFDKLFPHKLLPHYVWILNGKVKAITGKDDLLSSNIRSLLEGSSPNFKKKRDLDSKEITEIFNSEEYILYKSVLRMHIAGIASSKSVKRNSNRFITEISYVNVPVSLLYQDALGVIAETVIFNAGDSIAHDKYCYELKIQPSTEQKAYEFMRKDILNFFPYKVKFMPGKVVKVYRQ